MFKIYLYFIIFIYYIYIILYIFKKNSLHIFHLWVKSEAVFYLSMWLNIF